MKQVIPLTIKLSSRNCTAIIKRESKNEEIAWGNTTKQSAIET
jgi:hypothetical protein